MFRVPGSGTGNGNGVPEFSVEVLWRELELEASGVLLVGEERLELWRFSGEWLDSWTHYGVGHVWPLLGSPVRIRRPERSSCCGKIA